MAQPPAGVAGPVCYGPKLRAAVTQIAYLGHVSMERTATLLADLLGCPVSTGFVASCLTRLADKLDGFEADLKDALAGAERLHHDETPVPVNGERLRRDAAAPITTMTPLRPAPRTFTPSLLSIPRT